VEKELDKTLEMEDIIINSPIDCCIACAAMEAEVLLLDRGHDFERIAEIKPLVNEFYNPVFPHE
jgi:predicted nucleic acid-binding protein